MVPMLDRTPEEREIDHFLTTHPEIDKRRKQKNAEALEQLQKKKILEVKYLMTPDGSVGRYVKFEGEPEFILIRNDREGNQTVSKGLNRDWFQVTK